MFHINNYIQGLPLFLLNVYNMKTGFLQILCAIALTIPTALISQNSISGQLTNENGDTLSDVTVVMQNTYNVALSETDGTFKFTNLKDGQYILRMASIGNENFTDTIVIKGKDITKVYSLKTAIYSSEEVVIQSTRANSKTPTTYTNITKSQIEESNFGQDIPYILGNTPSTVVTSDAGAGVGYTGIRIRGVDPTRTNVTINGIPVNDPEGHGVWWVNMPDFVSSVNSIQVQRGVGTSTNGAAAFGASINMTTNELNKKAYAEIANSYGSFNTWKNTIKAGTGLINNKFTFDTRISQIQSDGYIDRASSDLKSYYLAGAYHGKKTVLRANVFGGKEVTYQAWYGTPESKISGNTADIQAYIDRNWIPQDQADNLLNSGRTYNFYTYDNEVDNYNQDHYQLHLTHKFSSRLNFNISGHYTYGRGYFEQFRKDDDFSTYNLSPVIAGTDTTTTTDLIRRRWLDNHFYGTVYSLNFNNKKGFALSIGGAANNYEGKHFGEIIWARLASDSEIRDRYYDNYANKSEFGNYVKASFKKNKLTYHVDVQHRYIHYSFLGQSAVNGVVFPVNRNVNYNFLNPKAGVSMSLNNNSSLYASLGVSNREPVRGDFTETSVNSQPLPEQLQNIEAGYRLKKKNLFLNANFYFMNYKNQLVLTGQINDVGASARTNVEKSYRTGIELESGFLIGKKFSIGANLTISRNKLPTFTEYVADYDNGGQAEIIHTNTNISFSPSVITGAFFTWTPVKRLKMSLLPKFVGDQFLDNTSDEERKINSYFITHFRTHYSFKTKLFKELNLGLQVNNVFNYMYENNGYTWGYIAGGEHVKENFYYPQAGRNFLINLVAKF